MGTEHGRYMSLSGNKGKQSRVSSNGKRTCDSAKQVEEKELKPVYKLQEL
jgi:hypothetical protein